MRNEISKTQNNQFPSMQGRAELQTILSKYFDLQSAEEVKSNLTDLLSIWTSSDQAPDRTPIVIADMVFFVSNLSIMVRKVSAFKCLPGHYTDLMEQLPADYVEDLLNEVLQSWICVDEYSTRPLVRVADAVTAFNSLGKLVAKLETFSVEGGVRC